MSESTTQVFKKAGIGVKLVGTLIVSIGVPLTVYYSGLEVMRAQVRSQEIKEIKVQKIDDRVSSDHDIIVEIRTEQRATRGDIAEIKRMVTEYADNAAALSAGLVAGDVYRTVDALKVVH